MNYRKKIALSTILILFFSLFFVVSVDAVGTTSSQQLSQDMTSQLNAFGGQFGASTETTSDVRIIIARIIRIVLSLMSVVTLAYVVYGGYMYMFAGGNDERVGKARKIIFYGVIGIAIMIASFSITSFVYTSIYGAINPWEGSKIFTQPNNSQYYNKDPMGGNMVPDDYNFNYGELLK